MPELLPIAEMDIDRATSRLETTKLNPTRIFAMNTSRGSAFYTWQNGFWFGTGGAQINEADVPEQFRDEIVANPVTVGVVQGPNVTKTCQFCGQNMNSSEWDEHMVEHVNIAMQQAGSKPGAIDVEREADAASKEIQKITPKSDANQHRGR